LRSQNVAAIKKPFFNTIFYLRPKLLNRIKKRWTYLGSPFSMNSLTVAGLYIGALYIRMQWIFNLFLSKTSITLPKQLGKCLVLVSTFTVVIIAFPFLFPVTRVRFLRETPIIPWLGIAPRMVVVAPVFSQPLLLLTHLLSTFSCNWYED
jgi:hypothetical protein